MPPESFTLAAAQVEPVYHDKAGTLDKTCRYVEQAGRDGADIVVFPETYSQGIHTGGAVFLSPDGLI